MLQRPNGFGSRRNMGTAKPRRGSAALTRTAVAWQRILPKRCNGIEKPPTLEIPKERLILGSLTWRDWASRKMRLKAYVGFARRRTPVTHARNSTLASFTRTARE